MAKARQILRRRKTIQNIGKVTRTMELISTARYRQAEGRLRAVSPYTRHLEGMLERMVALSGERLVDPLTQPRPQAPREALVVLASNRGLCGGYNAALLRVVRERVAQWRDEGRAGDIYAYGRKAISALRFSRIEVAQPQMQFETSPSIEDIMPLADELMDRYRAGELRAVTVAYWRFLSAGAQQPVLAELLPLGTDQTAWGGAGPPPDDVGLHGSAEYEFLPDREAILQALLPQAVQLRLFRSFLDALASEQIARMTAMRQATENGQDMVRLLTMQYNRARQTTITTELSEIIGGMEAMQ